MEQKNWSVVRRAVGHHRYDTAATPYQRVLAEPGISKKVKSALTREYESLNPAQIRRDLLDLQDQLLDLVKAKYQPAELPVKPPSPTRAPTREAMKTASRASDVRQQRGGSFETATGPCPGVRSIPGDTGSRATLPLTPSTGPV